MCFLSVCSWWKAELRLHIWLETMEDEHDTNKRTVSCLPGMPALPRETGTRNKVRVPSSKLNLCTRRASINSDLTRRSKNSRDRRLVTYLQIPEHFPALSIRLSEVLDGIGAGKFTVMERRETYLLRERMETIAGQLSGVTVECFHFGSQSEGTTTPGLNSDIDMLQSYYHTNIMTDWRDWKAGLHNLLMLHDDHTPPQQYLLQVISEDTPEPETRLCDERYVRKDSGQVLFSSEQWKKETEQMHKVVKDDVEITKHGPSFVREEAYCAPYILWFEMKRNMTEEVSQRRIVGKQWMDYAEVAARPFLRYLQYLTYGGLVCSE
ncbi:uncharacterized protein LOC127854713 [Dreissena polymorpha]|uniref:uncharacterized protein LOC127854713 n=1 Tax=Dreissena polymorpha TaxID=45954 RepID=UPI002265219B|nr:uncharacterized protein LOC127854713 [Dreissena polymorpha]